jgi:drug/metabolite transporter (DMT)-like permease
MKNLFYIIIAVCISSLGQILLRRGMNGAGFELSALDTTTILDLIKNFYVMSGLLVYGLSFILWLYVLSRVQVSYAYPFVSLSYPIVMILSNVFLKEPLGKGLWIGVFFILIGTTIIGATYGGWDS